MARRLRLKAAISKSSTLLVSVGVAGDQRAFLSLSRSTRQWLPIMLWRVDAPCFPPDRAAAFRKADAAETRG